MVEVEILWVYLLVVEVEIQLEDLLLVGAAVVSQ